MKKVRLSSKFDFVPAGSAVRGMRTFPPGEHNMPDAAASAAVAKGVGTILAGPSDAGEGASPSPAHPLATENVTRKK